MNVLQSKGIWHTAQKAAENLDKAKHIIEEDLEQVGISSVVFLFLLCHFSFSRTATTDGLQSTTVADLLTYICTLFLPEQNILYLFGFTN